MQDIEHPSVTTSKPPGRLDRLKKALRLPLGRTNVEPDRKVNVGLPANMLKTLESALRVEEIVKEMQTAAEATNPGSKADEDLDIIMTKIQAKKEK